MGFWTRPGPWVEVIVVCLRSELLDEAVCSLPKTPKGSEGDGHEVEVELLVLDGLVSRAAFVVRSPAARSASTRAVARRGVTTGIRPYARCHRCPTIC